MSLYSDYKVGAIDEDEYRDLCARENMLDKIDRERYQRECEGRYVSDCEEKDDEEGDNSN